MKNSFLKMMIFFLATILFASVAYADKLDEIKQRGVLKAGMHPGKAGFSTPNTKGRYTGFEIDFLRALTAAVLGDPDKIEYITMTSKNRLTALSSGEIDVLNRATTFTATREGNNGVDTTVPLFYDGQGFLARKDIGVTSATELDGATICVSPGTTSEKNMNDYFSANGISYKAVVLETTAEVKVAYANGRCDVITNDQSGLASTRLSLKDPDKHFVLPEIISKEPLGPYVRQGENRWREVVTWVAYALISAEEFGITQANVDQMAKTGSAEVKRLLGSEGSIGIAFGLDKEWARRAIKVAGNYGEMYERHLGVNTPLQFKRGLNALWKDGGLLYPYPFR